MKQRRVGGGYQLVTRGPRSMPKLPDDVYENDEQALHKFFSQHMQELSSLQQATIYKNNFSNCQRRLCRIWRQHKSRCVSFIKELNSMEDDLNSIQIPGMLAQLRDVFYSMCKTNNLEETIINYIFLVYEHADSVIKSVLTAGSSCHDDSSKKMHRFGFEHVKVGNYACMIFSFAIGTFDLHPFLS